MRYQKTILMLSLLVGLILGVGIALAFAQPCQMEQICDSTGRCIVICI
jgi:hypothetical protein